ncbi:four-carbon acid sugar kinase family protein [Yoonia vestfoldensis]|uniref:Type III effector n=1 Tax=Yoonia vestfoldensis TaxID=245188 RepID=A0A1Y0E9V3_9RHOB|nr:four-carbon acid sugar kinase family protein [Yoonia vestfoldensis]ARU00394.1 type III effector [Yoonia vestfoldensis]
MTQQMNGLPEGPLVAWYADDFTGAAAVMEVLSFAGLPAMLFLAPPTAQQLARYPDLQGIGVASTARAQTPGWMDAELPDIFAQLAGLNPQILHYKVCSTLDSAPQVGSIGRAIEIGAAVCAPAVVPVLIAAPQMRRYQCFGHLFAGFQDQIYRLDRHPVMSCHPVTPMHEADVAKHIAEQSPRLDVSCLSLPDLPVATALPGLPAQPGQIAVVTLDCMDSRSESNAGRLIWESRQTSPFVVGSQGVEYALVRHWQDTGQILVHAAPKGVGHVDKMVVVSGSVSPTTAAQISWAKANGFAGIAFDATCVCAAPRDVTQEIARCIGMGLHALSQGSVPLIYTAQGPDDPAVARFRAAVDASTQSMDQANQQIGDALGRVLHHILRASGARRAIAAGGDTAGHVTRQLGIFALSALAPTIAGAALFQAHADGPMDGLELALKGGQMGSPDYFGWIRDGGGTR